MISGTNGTGILTSGESRFIIADSTISNNERATGVGGIGAYGVMTITGSTIDNNKGKTAGGISALNFSSSVSLTISNTTVINNNSSGSAGGIAGTDGVRIYNSTISNNSAVDDGGGLYILAASQNFVIVNTTVSDNSAGAKGGGIYNAGNLDILHATVYSNSASEGGGMYNEGIITVKNSIIAEGGGGDCFINSGVVDIDSFNLGIL